MKKHILISLLIASQAQAVLQPASNIKGAPTNDSLIGYQWPLMPKDQYSEQDLDDIHSKKIVVDPKFSIGWKNFDAQMKRDVIVAVMDSGLNTSHPEIKDHLVPGFNFAAKKGQPTNIYDDDKGHGTHIAGIIAATSNNQIGITGLTGKVKIMPLKVYNKVEDLNPTKPTTPGGLSPLLDRVVKAIDFAIANKADVINFSMGWPRISNTDAVRAAFQRAQDAGIIIVAAAGNDGHDAQIYPCAYKGVICVASMDLDGKMSSFSNRGGHVDVAAPGQEIISLWPQVQTSMDLGIKGYEVKSGTSQAAPFVTATAAILRGVYPQESAKQIRSRILLAARNWDRSVAYGSLNMEKALQANASQLSNPVFKGIEDAEVNPQTLKFSVPLLIEKGSAANAKVQVASESKDIQVLQLRKVSETAAEAQYEIQAQASSLKAANKWAYSVQVNGRPFRNQILLQLPIQKLSQNVISVPAQDPSMLETNGLLTAYNPRNTADNAYWSYMKKEGGLQLSLWTTVNGKLVEKTVFLAGISEPQPGFNVIAEDFDFDGVTDYLFSGLMRNENDEFSAIRMVYLNSALQVTHDFKVSDNGANSIPTYRSKADIAFVKISKPGLKPMKVPVYWDFAWVPDEDKNSNFNNEPDYQTTRLYYLEPAGANEMRVRTLVAGDLARLIREELNASVRLDINVMSTRLQSAEDAKLGRTQMLFSIGRGVEVTNYLIPITDLGKPITGLSTWKQLPPSSVDLANNQTQETWDLVSGQVQAQNDFQAIYNVRSARSVVFGERDTRQPSKLQLPGITSEQIVSLTKTYKRGQDRVTFFETTDYLRVQGTWNARAVNGKSLIYRSTFLPGVLFSQVFVPVVVSSQQSPGILVNNSQIFSNTILTYSVDESGILSSPIGRTFELPANCSMKNPQINASGYSRIPFLCKEATGYQMRFVDLN